MDAEIAKVEEYSLHHEVRRDEHSSAGYCREDCFAGKTALSSEIRKILWERFILAQYSCFAVCVMGQQWQPIFGRQTKVPSAPH
jgi:hypothetical protein